MSKRLMMRITAPTVAISLLLLAVGVGAAWYVQRSQKDISGALRRNIRSMRAAEEIEIDIREARTQLDHFLLSGDRKYLDAVPAVRPEIDRWLTEASRCAITPHEQELMDRARQGCLRFFTELDGIVGQAPGNDRALRVRRLIDEVLEEEILKPTHEYLDFNEDEVEKASAASQTLADRLVLGLLLLGTCGSGAGLVAGLGIARGINRSLVQLSVPIRAAAGQLDEVVGPITFAASWDLHELEGVLRLIADRIGAIIERLRQSEREVLRAEQLAAVGQMAAGMAHELRNPLTSMKILVQSALARDCPGHPAGGGSPGAAPGPGLGGRDLAVLEEEITRLEHLVQAFLHFARPPEVEKRPLEVRALVEQTVALVAARAALRPCRIECVLPPEPVLATVDPGQVRQVLLNLLLNAVEAVPPGGTIRVSVEAEPDRWLTLRVTDTGCGLPVALGSRIFAPFVSTKETGLGLGLSICKRIVEAHGGTIIAANRPGGGAVFTVRLPVSNQESGVKNQRSEVRSQMTSDL
jgi:signal transduction histidine kinase